MFSTKIKEARTAKGLSQDDMAKQLGITARTYLDYEKGKNEPKISTAKKIAQILEIPLIELMDEEISDDDLTIEQLKVAVKSLDEEDKKALRRIILGLRMSSAYKVFEKDIENFTG